MVEPEGQIDAVPDNVAVAPLLTVTIGVPENVPVHNISEIETTE